MPTPSTRALLEKAYRATLYEFDTPAGGARLRIDEPSAAIAAVHAAFGVEHSGIITGWNPHSVPRPLVSNDSANRRLLARLKAADYKAWPARHIAIEHKWNEQGYFVPGIPLELLLELGREFNQHAVVHIDDHAVPRLVWCQER
jgi:hypothetical protein